MYLHDTVPAPTSGFSKSAVSTPSGSTGLPVVSIIETKSPFANAGTPTSEGTAYINVYGKGGAITVNPNSPATALPVVYKPGQYAAPADQSQAAPQSGVTPVSAYGLQTLQSPTSGSTTGAPGAFEEAPGHWVIPAWEAGQFPQYAAEYGGSYAPLPDMPGYDLRAYGQPRPIEGDYDANRSQYMDIAGLGADAATPNGSSLLFWAAGIALFAAFLKKA